MKDENQCRYNGYQQNMMRRKTIIGLMGNQRFKMPQNKRLRAIVKTAGDSRGNKDQGKTNTNKNETFFLFSPGLDQEPGKSKKYYN